MEVLLISALYSRIKQWAHVGSPRDTFVQIGDDMRGSKAALVLTVCWFVVAGFLSSYLSWRANTLAGWGSFMRCLFALVAFLSGTAYMILHTLLKGDLVFAAYNTQALQVTQQQQQPPPMTQPPTYMPQQQPPTYVPQQQPPPYMPQQQPPPHMPQPQRVVPPTAMRPPPQPPRPL